MFLLSIWNFPRLSVERTTLGMNFNWIISSKCLSNASGIKNLSCFLRKLKIKVPLSWVKFLKEWDLVRRRIQKIFNHKFCQSPTDKKVDSIATEDSILKINEHNLHSRGFQPCCKVGFFPFGFPTFELRSFCTWINKNIKMSSIGASYTYISYFILTTV